MAFAKLFGTDDDQILVMLDESDEETPEISLHFKPEGYGVCKIGSSFKDTEEGRQQAQAAFDAIDESIARKMVSSLIADTGLFT